MSLWRNKNFLILFSGQMVSVVGDNLFGIALLWYVLDITQSKGAVAVTGFAETLPPIIGLFVGVLVDRWSKKSTMIVSDTFRGCILFLLFTSTLLQHPPFWLIVSAVVALGVIGTFFQPAFNALLPTVVEKDQFAAVSGISQSAGATASLGGLLGGGALMAAIGAPLMFLCDGISFILSVISLFFIRVHKQDKRNTSNSFVKDWTEGLSVIRKSRFLMQSGFTATINNLSLAGTGVAVTVWVKDSLHGSAFLLGTTISAMLVGMIMGGALASWTAKVFSYRRVVSVGLITLGVSDSLTGLWVNAYWTMALMFLAGLSLGLVDGTSGAARMAVVPEDMRGRVFSTLSTMGRLATPVGSAVLGALLVHIPVAVVLSLTGVGPIIGGINFMLPHSKKGFDEVDAVLAPKHSLLVSPQESPSV